MAQAATKERSQTQQRPAGAQPGQASGNVPATTGGKAPHPLVAFKSYMDQRMGEIALALPPHMPKERFGRVVLTALQRTPALLNCTRQSLFNSCMLAAQDGLLPDGREGAIVPYADGKADQAQWMPMIEGLRKKARNSGEISNWEVHIVRALDHFEVVLGDNPRIDHKPYFGAEDPGAIIGAYSIAWLKDGSISRDVMTIRDIQKIQAVSKAKKGPWANPTFFPEMCKKTVARRHYKQLPHAAEMDEFIKRLDEREGFTETPEGIEARQQQRIGSTAAAFDAFAGAGTTAGPTIDHEDGGDDTPTAATDDTKAGDASAGALDDFTDGADSDQTQAGDAGAANGDQQNDAGSADDDAGNDAQDDAAGDPPRLEPGFFVYKGETANPDAQRDKASWPMVRLPKTEEEYLQYAEAYCGQMTDPSKVGLWFKSADQRNLRNACGVTQKAFEQAKGIATTAIAELQKSS